MSWLPSTSRNSSNHGSAFKEASHAWNSSHSLFSSLWNKSPSTKSRRGRWLETSAERRWRVLALTALGTAIPWRRKCAAFPKCKSETIRVDSEGHQMARSGRNSQPDSVIGFNYCCCLIKFNAEPARNQSICWALYVWFATMLSLLPSACSTSIVSGLPGAKASKSTKWKRSSS